MTERYWYTTTTASAVIGLNDLLIHLYYWYGHIDWSLHDLWGIAVIDRQMAHDCYDPLLHLKTYFYFFWFCCFVYSCVRKRLQSVRLP